MSGEPRERWPDVSDESDKLPIIAVVGATASGKSLLADTLALRMQGEIISADSMQVYQGMDIGTAKTPIDERSVPYHGIDLVSPDVAFTAALYQRYARAAIAEIQSRRKSVIFCGGTGLYLRAALDDFTLDEQRESSIDDSLSKNSVSLQRDDSSDDSSLNSSNSASLMSDSSLSEQHLDSSSSYMLSRSSSVDSRMSEIDQHPDNALRERLNAQALEFGAKAFHELLAKQDPDSAALIHPNNQRRVVRAFELLEQGLSYAQVSAGFTRYESLYPAQYIGLEVERELLYQMIDMRVDAMITAGLLGEVQVLISEGFADALTASQAIGYRQLVSVLAGQSTLKEALEAIKQATRRYAKRQLTWFRRDPRITWVEVSDLHQAHLAGELDRDELASLMLSRTMAVLQLPGVQG
ncbi:MAG: tRNA (adenosine(37)-N6)-dimethylallyltransferase MiaA [Coriobacteriales bacterium]|jgi:tRNA A37 N6-isopentenylltransferase MiaA|nr:tRNA (adenosine(37)-N6)-dimethylallyltransferase MiaA [Coriobacteriales bacterium]